ncbi:hypothetical protein MOE77_22520 [Bacillus inaquosorum]|uniref:hypothetical protein n=1 Tax=Bacillus inaquosorum TaxID=483913 RepID=UPI00227F2663|nr:hypothetical protein [Bacillus inaquosorum]MCY9039651.1 hypothetical protein [Bacillus inaquosorum]
MIVYQLVVSVCITLFAVGYSQTSLNVLSAPNTPSYLWLSCIVRNDTPILRQHLMAAFAFHMHV